MVMTHESGSFAKCSQAKNLKKRILITLKVICSGSELYCEWKWICLHVASSEANKTVLHRLWPRLQVLFQAAAYPLPVWWLISTLPTPPERSSLSRWANGVFIQRVLLVNSLQASGVNIERQQKDTCMYAEEEINCQQRRSWCSFKPTTSASNKCVWQTWIITSKKQKFVFVVGAFSLGPFMSWPKTWE